MTSHDPAATPAEPPRKGRTALRAVVLRTQHLTPAMVRVTLGGPGLAGFRPSAAAASSSDWS